jgi:integrase
VRIQGRNTRKTFLRRQDADTWLRQVRTDDLRGVAFDPRLGKVLFSTYAHDWIRRGGTRGSLAPKTTQFYLFVVRLYLEPEFGNRQLGSIRAEDVRNWYARLQSTKPSMAPKSYRTLAAIMKTALLDERIPTNPCNLIGAGVERAKERPLVHPSDAQEIADHIAPHFRCAVLLAEFAQLRLGEILGLQVGDVDLASSSINVKRQAIEVPVQGRITSQPKTRSGIRSIAIPMGLCVEMEKHIRQFCQDDPDAWVFANFDGRPWWRWEWQEAWTKAKNAVAVERTKSEKALLPDGLHFHDLRHSGLTYVAFGGATTKELMRRGGHASANAALRYQHEAEGRDQEIADALDRIMSQR